MSVVLLTELLGRTPKGEQNSTERDCRAAEGCRMMQSMTEAAKEIVENKTAFSLREDNANQD
jgi:hypothetical protein